MRNLAIFDIDGTITDSVSIDSECFVKSIKNEFGIIHIDTDWSNYSTATDGGIFEEIFIKHFNNNPTEKDIERHISSFVNLLKKEYENNHIKICEIESIKKFISYLKNNNWDVSIATGSWSEIALFKLKAIDLDVNDIPIATSSDFFIRDDIVLYAIQKSFDHYNVKEYNKIVSFGDSAWDYQVAKRLNINFMAIGNNIKLKLPNIKNCYENYKDMEALLKCLNRF